MKKRYRTWLLTVLVGLTALWLNNTSLFTDGTGQPILIAHRGLAHEMDPEHEDYRSCISRIHNAGHSFIENTMPSIKAAFDLGAAFVEIDVRQTADGQFAVFHDDVLDCKTEAKGLIADRSMKELKTLDVGYGYFTSDGAHPLRGLGVGLMPTLEEVLDHFPTGSFVINVKDNLGPRTAALAQIVEARENNENRELLIFGDNRTVSALRRIRPSLLAISRQSVRTCVRNYMILGWSGHVPDSCRNTATGMYANYAWGLWGWPHRFVDRMERAGTLVILTHPYQTASIHDLPETPSYAKMIPEGYSGAVITNRIDKIEDWLSGAR
ncbi:MAG: glycerophosphodiester phosphodiesterase [Chromatiales bacterium]|nr:MAG: glycerophosphodiester phosphodiesterase [Chromatiales bacterium]